MLWSIFINQFEEKFNISFDSVIHIEDLGVDTDDDGIYHYIHFSSKDVYSFNGEDEVWLEKNLHKEDILQRLNIEYS
jgi:hypothetical protein